MARRRKYRLACAVLIGAMGLSGAAHAGIKDRLRDVLRPRSVGQQRTLSGEEDIHQLVARNASAFDGALNAAAGSNSHRGGATKVVPLLVVGHDKAVGIAQVAGPTEAVRKVEAVAAVEVDLLAGKLEGRVLIPVDSRDLADGYRRVDRVGVAAALDYQL